jgi:hypothetical protein
LAVAAKPFWISSLDRRSRLADDIAGDARLRHFKDGTPDAKAIPDTHLAIGQPIDGEILPELPIAEIASTGLGLPIPV